MKAGVNLLLVGVMYPMLLVASGFLMPDEKAACGALPRRAVVRSRLARVVGVLFAHSPMPESRPPLEPTC